MATDDRRSVNRRAFFRRGMQELLKPLAPMAEGIAQPAARLPDKPPLRPQPADGRIARGSFTPEEGVTIDPYPPEDPEAREENGQ